MIDALNIQYFQKSRFFLYPLLEIKRGAPATPTSTSVAWKSKYSSEDIKFICCYKKRTDQEFVHFEKNVLTQHNRLIEKIEYNNTLIYIFDFSDYKADWEQFLVGKYSKIDVKTKRKILAFFDKYSSNFVYMESYLFPGKYFSLYAKLLHTDIELLQEVGELCSIPDINKETLELEIITENKNKKLTL
jgi:hypothetical protein